MAPMDKVVGTANVAEIVVQPNGQIDGNVAVEEI